MSGSVLVAPGHVAAARIGLVVRKPGEHAIIRRTSRVVAPAGISAPVGGLPCAPATIPRFPLAPRRLAQRSPDTGVSMSGISRRGGPHLTTRENEAALLARARAGDHAAWDVLIRRHREALVAAAERAPRATYEDPEDLVQRALARAWRMRASIRPGRGAFQAWASRIVQRVGCDSSGAQRHQRDLLEEAALPAGELPGVADGGAPPPWPNEIVAARKRETLARRVVAQCLPRLTALEADVVFHELQDGTAANFRKADGSPYSSAAYRQTLRRARAKVRRWASPWPLP